MLDGINHEIQSKIGNNQLKDELRQLDYNQA